MDLTPPAGAHRILSDSSGRSPYCVTTMVSGFVDINCSGRSTCCVINNRSGEKLTYPGVVRWNGQPLGTQDSRYSWRSPVRGRDNPFVSGATRSGSTYSQGDIRTPGERPGSEEYIFPGEARFGGRDIYLQSEARLGGLDNPGGKPGPEDFVYFSERELRLRGL